MSKQGVPQIEEGYVKIANELLDALIDVRMPGEVRRVFDYILRMTYGYNRKTFQTTHSKIAKRLKTERQRVTGALRWLSAANMIISTKNRADLSHNCLTTLGIQKRYRLWRSARKSVPIGTEKCADEERNQQESIEKSEHGPSARKSVPIDHRHGKVCRIGTEKCADEERNQQESIE
ncbi:MAG: replication protein, partial [Anaerolineales bacterium]